MSAQPPADRRGLWLGAPGADDSGRSRDEVRIIREMTGEDVDGFLLGNNIDVAAAKELRNEPPHIQLAVLERGPLRACVNPSGALVARIRDAKRGILGSSGRYGGSPPPNTLDPGASELDKFLAENRIDQAGVASMRSESVEVQRAVMARGPLVNTTNPSASLMARIRTVKLDAAGLGAAGSRAEGRPAAPGPAALEDAGGIDSGHLNEEALRAIRKLAGAGAGAPPEGAAAGREGAPRAKRPRAAEAIADAGDRRLQDEAHRAIEALQAAAA